MAEAFLISGVKMILNAVTAHVKSELALAWAAEGELKKLQDKLGILQLVLDEAEQRQVKEPPVRHWLEKLKKVAYDAQDVMDDFSNETTRREMEVPAVPHPLIKLFFDMVLNFCSSSNPILFQLKMAHMIQDINYEFDKIKKDMEEYNFIKGNIPLGPYNPGGDDDPDYQRETYSSSSAKESSVVGRETEKSNLVALLIDPASEEQDELSVLPIVGMGGLGKSTLTKLVYNDEQVKNYFKDLQMWVHVSQDFDVKKLLKDIITKSTDENSLSADDSNLQMLVGELQRKLGGKRFLLVLDNVWNEDLQKWEDLTEALLCGAKGSKILVTTRKNEVASLVGTLPTYQLHPLSDDDAWSLFKQSAFRKSARSEPRQDFVEIGNRIVKRCGGVPLALKIIGSQLKSVGENLDGWLYIQNSEIWNIPETREILRPLKVSYHILPSHLQQCFSYCSVFYKGESIQVDTLVQLWMAEGFINAPTTTSNKRNENKVLEEDVGRRYVQNLVDSSFFQDEERDKWGEVTSFKMHDLIHDLAQSVVSPVDRTSVSVDSVEQDGIVGARRQQVVFTGEGASTAMQGLGDLMSKIGGGQLRVLILSNYFYGSITIRNLSPLTNLKRLRVLILNYILAEELPNSISNLKHLRYLDISHSRIEVLPAAITTLYNLQTLKLNYCYKLAEIPSDITRKLINLRHLELRGTDMSKTPKEISRLRFLQTLPLFTISKEGGCNISELGGLHHLRHELEIQNLENVENREAAERANLVKKQRIRELVFKWIRSTHEMNQCKDYNDADVLEGLRPHNSLQGLRIHNFMGAEFPKWLKSDANMLPNLVEIELQSLSNCVQLPAFGSFPNLRSLRLDGMWSVKHIGSNFYGDTVQGGREASVLKPPFPSLKLLYIRDLTELEEWAEAQPSTMSPSSSSAFPVLEELTIEDCLNLRTMPTFFPMLRKLSIACSSNATITLLGTSKLTSLTSLAISYMFDLTELPPGLLSNNRLLQHLEIVDCRNLRTFPREELPRLPALEFLDIGGFWEGIDSYLFQQGTDEENGDDLPLNGLKTLKLRNSDRCLFLPEQIQRYTAIENLYIRDFPRLLVWPDWLGSLRLLRHLELESCPRLYFPPQEQMRRLTALQMLCIIECDKLEGGCTSDRGADWDKISHIPWVSINYTTDIFRGSQLKPIYL